MINTGGRCKVKNCYKKQRKRQKILLRIPALRRITLDLSVSAIFHVVTRAATHIMRCFQAKISPYKAVYPCAKEKL